MASEKSGMDVRETVISVAAEVSSRLERRFGARAEKDYWGASIDADHVRQYILGCVERFALVVASARRFAGPPPRRVMEVGPAYGVTALSLRRLGYEVLTCEMPDSISVYCHVLLEEGVRVEPWDIHASECPLAEHEFDVIIASEVLEHLQMSLRSAIERLHRALAPNGILVLTTPNLRRLSNVVRLLSGRNICEAFPHNPDIRNGLVIDSRTHPWEPTPHDLCVAVRQCGLSVRIVTGFTVEASGWLRRLAYAMAPRGLGEHILVVAQKA